MKSKKEVKNGVNTLKESQVEVLNANELLVKVEGAEFYFSREEIEETLEESWVGTESWLVESNGVKLELYPKNYRNFIYKLNHFE